MFSEDIAKGPANVRTGWLMIPGCFVERQYKIPSWMNSLDARKDKCRDDGRNCKTDDWRGRKASGSQLGQNNCLNTSFLHCRCDLTHGEVITENGKQAGKCLVVGYGTRTDIQGKRGTGRTQKSRISLQ